jgi:hypothetical protein
MPPEAAPMTMWMMKSSGSVSAWMTGMTVNGNATRQPK